MSFKFMGKIGKACFHVLSEKKHPFTSAVILAAGKGERMKTNGVTKQLMEIQGIPVIVHTLLAFNASEYVDEIVVVGAESELPRYKEFKKLYDIQKLKLAVGGGSCRAISAKHGFLSISKECEYLLIHDGARCIITTEDIDTIIKESYKTGAVIAAKKATDTVKKVDENGFIVETPNRDSLYLAETPQAFKKTVYEVALAKAGTLDASVTDDSMLVSAAGFHCKVFETMHENIKITRKEDLKVADAILKKRKESEDAKI